MEVPRVFDSSLGPDVPCGRPRRHIARRVPVDRSDIRPASMAVAMGRCQEASSLGWSPIAPAEAGVYAIHVTAPRAAAEILGGEAGQ